MNNNFRAVSYRPKSYELVFVIFAPILGFLVSHTGFPFSRLLIRLIIDKAGFYLLLVYGLALVVVLSRALIMKLRKESFSTSKDFWRAASRPYCTRGFFYRTISRTFILLFTLFFFLHLKHLILWWHKANYDLFFWDLDRKIHFGIQPNVWLLDKLSDKPELEVALDWLYATFFQYNMLASVFFLLEIKGEDLSNRFCCAFSLIWFLGGLSYLIAPSDGPCYAVLSSYSIPTEQQTHIFAYPVVKALPENFAREYVDAKIWKAKGYQERLWTDRRKFMRREAIPSIFYGIAAFPSLHVGISVLFALYFFHASVLAGGLALIYAIAMAVGSVLLQWHYALDAYGGTLLALLVYVLTISQKILKKA